MKHQPAVDRIRHILESCFSPSQLEVIDESALHIGHSGARPGGETHFRIRIRSASFSGKSKLEAHRMIYGALAEEFNTGLHAAAIEVIEEGRAKEA